MREALTKAQWQEKKKHVSEINRRAAVSVQTARIIDKLLERSQGLSGRSVEQRTKAITASRSLEGASESKNQATLTDRVVNYNLGEARDTISISTGERKTKSLFGKKRTVKTASILQTSKDMLDSRIDTRQLDVDREGKQKPSESYRYGVGDRYSDRLTSEEVVHRAAPALYEVKKAIDEAEEQKKRRAA